MTRTGEQYIESLRDGRQVFIDGEVVKDVTRHPAFAGAVASVAALYDQARDPEHKDVLTYTSPDSGEPVSAAYMIPRTQADLATRRAALRRSASSTFGLMGRSPDHVACFLAGFAGSSELFARGGREFADNVVNFYKYARDNDQYVTYTIVPPQIDRSKPAHQQSDPHLYAGVKEERDDGIVIKGAQMLGTGTVLANWVLLTSIVPLRPGDENYAISVVVPVSAPGVKVLSRRSYAEAATSTFDYPLASRFDETDSLVIFDDVLVPWEHVFIYRDLDLVSAQWSETSAHVLGNNQAQIRFAVKLDFLTGVATKVAEMNQLSGLPPIQGTLAHIAAHAAMVNGLVLGAEQNCSLDEYGVMRPGHAETYANMTLQSEIYPKLLNMVRELCGGGLIQLPSSDMDFANPEIADQVERYVQSPGTPAVERVKLLKLAWDLVGSEFASRHHQYELFYAGAPFLVKLRMFQNYDFAAAKALVDQALAGYDLNGRLPAGAAEARAEAMA